MHHCNHSKTKSTNYTKNVVYISCLKSSCFLFLVNVADEYCLYKFYGQNNNVINQSSLYDILNDTYCEDIDFVLTNYCGNKALFAEIDTNYVESTDTDQTCVFYLENGQTISKSYSLSSHPSLNQIIFTSKSENLTNDNGTEIELSQSFLSISGFEGNITIENIIYSASNGSQFSFIDVTADNTELAISINQCEFYDISAVNGAIINIPNNGVATDYLKGITISIEFSDSHIF